MEDEIKPKFWDTEDGKIMSVLIHDINSAVGIISSASKLLRKAKEESDVISDDTVKVYLDMIDRQTAKINKTVDYIFLSVKKKNGY